MMIIDPPVTPFSPPEKIEAWLKKLATYPQDAPEVQEAIIDARKYLEFAKNLENKLRLESFKKAA